MPFKLLKLLHKRPHFWSFGSFWREGCDVNGESSAEDGRRQKRDSLTVLPGWNFAQVVVINFSGQLRYVRWMGRHAGVILAGLAGIRQGQDPIGCTKAECQRLCDAILGWRFFQVVRACFSNSFQYCFTQCFHIFSLFPARVSISGFGGRNFLLIDRNSTQPGTLGTAVHRVKSCVTHCGWSLLVSSNLFPAELAAFSARIHWGGPAWFHALL